MTSADDQHKNKDNTPDGAPTPPPSIPVDQGNLDAENVETLTEPDLDPEESADVMETREEAHRMKQARDDQTDDGLITLDPGD